MNCAKRGSRRCLALSCFRVWDWQLQNRAEIFSNQPPSVPSNCGGTGVRGRCQPL